jgi:hypothetical protein
LPRPGDYWLVLEAPSELIGLLKDQTEGIELIAKGDALQLFRFSLSADDLPLAFGTSLDTITGRKSLPSRR